MAETGSESNPIRSLVRVSFFDLSIRQTWNLLKGILRILTKKLEPLNELIAPAEKDKDFELKYLFSTYLCENVHMWSTNCGGITIPFCRESNLFLGRKRETQWRGHFRLTFLIRITSGVALSSVSLLLRELVRSKVTIITCFGPHLLHISYLYVITYLLTFGMSRSRNLW